MNRMNMYLETAKKFQTIVLTLNVKGKIIIYDFIKVKML